MEHQFRQYGWLVWASSILLTLSLFAVILNNEELSLFSFQFSLQQTSVEVSTVPNRRILIATLLTDDLENYANGAKMLIKSIKNKSSFPMDVDFRIMEIETKPIEDKVIREMLTAEGWSFFSRPRISPRDEAGTIERFRDQFSKLHFWNMTEYERVLYFDSDCFVLGSVDELVNMDISDKPLWVTRDINKVWIDRFNMGVFMIRPSSAEFDRLVQAKEDPSIHFETAMSEQGFLNAFYKNQWGEIGFRNNANLAVYTSYRSFWDENFSRINVVHYTMRKPWACGGPTYQPICKLWHYT